MPALMLAVALIMIIAAIGLSVVAAHHEHIENIIENAGADNSTLETVDRVSAKFVPFLVLFGLVLAGVGLVYGLIGGF